MRDDFNTEMFTGMPVIQFDLPKGYSAMDAYESAIWWMDSNDLLCDPEMDCKHDQSYYGVNFIGSSLSDVCNFYLLLAYANGFKE